MRHSTKDTPSSRAIRNTITLDNRPLQPIERSAATLVESSGNDPPDNTPPITLAGGPFPHPAGGDLAGVRITVG
ncbi:hypothetical protein VTN96DRAFT_6625 [Rasamsonia emersonii]